MEKNLESNSITIEEYFSIIKKLKQKTTQQEIAAMLTSYKQLGQKYMKTGQTDALKRIVYYSNVAMREQCLLDVGIDTYVQYDDVQTFQKRIDSKHIHLIELERYEREIPDDIVKKIEQTTAIFDQFYVLFTDYSGQHAKKDKQEKIEKDPILFGAFKADSSLDIQPTARVYPRLYFVGDWVDEYCDLTFDKFVNIYKTKIQDKKVTHMIEKTSFEQMKEFIRKKSEEEQKERLRTIDSRNIAKKKGFVERVISWLKFST